MKQEEINSGNKLIAEFTGKNVSGSIIESAFSKEPNLIWYTGELKYHVSWDRLMEVVEMINSDTANAVTIRPSQCSIYVYKNGGVSSLEKTHRLFVGNKENTIDAVYAAVIDFINYYNKRNIQGED